MVKISSNNLNFHNMLFVLLVCLISFQIVCYILAYPYLIISDDVEFVDFLLFGKNFPWNIIPNSGRFFPLARIEYLPILTTDIPLECKMLGMSVLNSAKVLLFTYLSFKLFNKFVDIFCSSMLIFVLFCLLLCYGAFPMFLTTIYPEFTLSILTVVFILLYNHALANSSDLNYFLLFLVAITSIFFKESFFIIFFCISFFRVATMRSEMEKSEMRFHVTIFIITVSFAILYYALMYKNAPALYTDQSRTLKIFFQNFFQHLKINFLFFPSLMVFIGRMYAIGSRKKRSNLYDAFLFCSIIYSSFFPAFNLLQKYYFIPSLILSFNSFVFIFKKELTEISDKLQRPIKLGLILLFALFVSCLMFYYINFHSLAYFYKRSTKDFVTLIATTKSLEVGTKFYFPIDEKIVTQINKNILLWKLQVLNKIYQLYSLDKNEFEIVSSLQNVDYELRKNNIVVFDKESLPMHYLPKNTITLDYLFLEAAISPDNELAKNAYCVFAKKVIEKNINYIHIDSIYKIAEKLSCAPDKSQWEEH